MKILCFGDSITYGESDEIAGGWVERLKVDLIKRYQNQIRQEVTICNLGIGGETTDGLARRFQNEFNARVHKNEKSIVILFYGTNDIVIHKQKNTVPIKYFYRNIASCIDYCRNLDSTVFLIGSFPVSQNNDGKINQHGQVRYKQDVTIYNERLKAIANENACEFVDLLGEFECLSHESYFALDKVHPNENGHYKIYELVLERLVQSGVIIK